MKKYFKSIYRSVPLKKQLYLLLKKFYKPSHNIYKHLHFVGVFNVEVDKAHSFLIKHHGFEVENEIFWNGLTGGWEKVSLSLWIELAKHANIILDIGANTGIYALIAKSLNPAAKVYALEPVQRVFKKLVENNSLNHYDIICLEKAASNFDGTATIYDTGGEHTYSVTVNKNLNNKATSTFTSRIETIKISSLAESEGLTAIDLVKIDVETHEAEVIEGFGIYLKKYQPTLLIEILNDEVARGVTDYIQDIPYLYFNIDENKGIRQVTQLTKSDYYNFLLCSKETATKLKLI